MKYALILVLVVLNPVIVSAQKNNLFADIGVPAGLSITADHHLTKHLSVGAGLQVYRFTPTITNRKESVPAIFADMRLNSRQRKKHFFFYFLDLGVNLYKANDDRDHYNALFDYVPKNDGFYPGLGLGYFRSMTKHGGGIYVSLKTLGNMYHVNEYDYKRNEQHVALVYDGTLALSIGFKF